MSFMQFFGVGIAGVITLYVGARLVFHAYFKSKQDHEDTRTTR